ncbi:uncharacterized protein RSE6_05552 [Rhynchosporium secalis]|uniref:Kelch repeat protein n=1 Tax=Rhynchosporium secalis TaxID=38038 RepID=A0A1E1M844_RHYSE|nr:uncharacterized protein RSE6_05552 [Rhynchosporium secalis]
MSSIIVGDSLYIEGGEYYITGAASYADILYPPTRSIDLSKSWTTSSVVINQINRTGINACERTIAKPGLFWQESTRSIIVFGGDTSNAGSKKAVCGLKVRETLGGESWYSVYGTNNPLWKTITWPRHPSFAYGPTESYALGGFTTTADSNVGSMLMSMTVMNKTTNLFEGQSDVGEFSQTGGVNQGEGHFIPSFGGLVVFIGGVAYSNGAIGSSLRSMSKIDIYNPSTQKWYSQSASGDVPSGRKTFCMTGAQGTNHSTYEIFVYGGSGLEFFSDANSDSRNVYILTLPAFRWIRAGALTAPRAGSSCQTVKNQMISYGGFDPTGTTSFERLEPWAFGIGIFDLHSLKWGVNYNPNAPAYVQSTAVSEFYESNSMYPIWDDENLGSLFLSSKASSTSATSPTTSPPGTTSSTSTPETLHPSKTPVAAIAGGTVGGVAALAAVIFAWWFWRSRRSGKPDAAPRDSEPVVSGLHDTPAVNELPTERRPEMASTGYNYHKVGQNNLAPKPGEVYEVHA